MALTGAVATIVWPHVFMRCYIAKSTKNFRVMSWALPLAHLVLTFGLVIVGSILAPAILGSNFPEPDKVMPMLANQYCTPLIAFVSILCLFAFAVSTADSMLLSASAMASRDIYIRHFYEKKGRSVDSRKVVYFGRVVLVVEMIACIVITVTKSASIIDYAYKLSSPFFAMILPCTIGGLFWKKGTKEGAIAGTVSGVIITTIFTFFVMPPFGFSALLWGLATNIVFYVGVSLVTTVPAEISEKYITRVERIISGSTEIFEITNAAVAEAKQA